MVLREISRRERKFGGSPGSKGDGRYVSKTRKNANKVKSESLLNSRVLFRFFLGAPRAVLTPFANLPVPSLKDAYCLVFTPHVTK